MTRTERSFYPRAVIKDRSESKTGMDKSIRKGGAGQHNWGSLTDETSHYFNPSELEELHDQFYPEDIYKDDPRGSIYYVEGGEEEEMESSLSSSKLSDEFEKVYGEEEEAGGSFVEEGSVSTSFRSRRSSRSNSLPFVGVGVGGGRSNERRSSVHLITQEEIDNAKRIRSIALKKPGEIDLVSIARSSVALSSSPPTATSPISVKSPNVATFLRT